MKERRYSNLTEAMTGLKEAGFTCDFVLDGEKLKSSASGKTYEPHQLTIVYSYRFEGESNPDDMAVLYAIETSGGEKGTISDAFGLYADKDLGDFLAAVPDSRDEDQQPSPSVIPSDPVR